MASRNLALMKSLDSIHSSSVLGTHQSASTTSVSFQLAFSQLEILANRLWKTSDPDSVDFVFGRIWLHSIELAHRLNSTTVADILASIDFGSDQLLHPSDGCNGDSVIGVSALY